jgi:hypothetical protein
MHKNKDLVSIQVGDYEMNSKKRCATILKRHATPYWNQRRCFSTFNLTFIEDGEVVPVYHLIIGLLP